MTPARVANFFFFRVQCSVQIHVIARRGGVAGLKPPQLRGEIFHSQDSHKPPTQAKQVIKSPYICASTWESHLSPGKNRENIGGFKKLCIEFAVFAIWFVWSEVGNRDHLLDRRRQAPLLRRGHFSDSWSGLRLFFSPCGGGWGRGYWEAALGKHPPLMRPTQLEPVCPGTAVVRCPLAEVMRTFTRSSAGLQV